MQRKLTFIALAISMILLVFAMSKTVHAGTLTVSREGSVNTVHYNGPVTVGDSEALQRYIEMYRPEAIHLTSPGGVAQEGYKLGYVLMEYTGVVVADGSCLSACAIAFLAAPNKQMEGIIGFHPAWTEETDIPPSAAMKAGQAAGLSTAFYMFETGYSLQFAYVFTVLASKDVFFVFQDLDDLESFKGDIDYFRELSPQYLADHLAGPERLHMLQRGY